MLDLRMLVLGATAWAAALGARWLGWWTLGASVLAVAALVVGHRRTVTGIVLVFVGVAGVTTLRAEQVGSGPVAELAAEGAAVTVDGTVISDPRRSRGRFADLVITRLDVREVTGRGVTYGVGVPVLVLGDTSWSEVALGSTVRVSGRLSAADGDDLAGVLGARGPPEVRDDPDVWWDGAAVVRAAIRDAVSHRPAAQRALVPALVDGDDAQVDEELAEDFRTTGLTHLLAVSGTNLTLVVGFLLVLARGCRVRGRWLYLVGAAGIVGFVLLARTEPSVLRAAVMGTVALFAMGTDGRRRGARALGVALVVLLLVKPTLAVSPGFALSVLATAGIVLLAPVWRDALARWMPRWTAEAIAIPLAAQLACTPVVAAISGQVSLVAVVANLVVAPAVGPATVLGLGGGLVGLLWEPAGRLLGTGAGWCVAWIVAVATRGASLPTAAVEWGTSAAALALLTALVVGVALVGPRLVRRPVPGIACCLVMVVAVLVRPPSLGWPPEGWILVACDVGQGDALVVNAGEAGAVVVDAGPDPTAVDRCLDDLEVEQVPLVVLTHFHADHIDGLPGVLAGRDVGAVETTTVLEPPAGVADVAAATGSTPVPFGESRQVGAVTLQSVWPPPDATLTEPNDASVVLLAEVSGVRLLLTGDVEPEAQGALARLLPGLRADVLKVPHHGSRYQDEDWLVSLGARIALVSVGADNDYGHPSDAAIAPLVAAGTDVGRTDLEGDLAVLVDEGVLSVTSR
ncbi:MAG: ComEC/Rec2 family competence protein [Nocardioides sp.]